MNTVHPRARLDPASALAALVNAPRDLAVVVVGGGKTGALAAKLALRLGADVAIVDDAPLAKVRAGLEKGGLARELAVAAPFARAAQVRARLVPGGIDHDALVSADLIVLSPGVPRAHPAIAAALRAGVPVVNEVELAAAVLRSRGVKPRVIGITGTNGKSTTTTLCGAIAKAADANAFVGGNLGTPYCACALAVLDGKPAPRFAVLELSSYQLETISTLAFDAAVVTNLTPDHLDRYPNVSAYYAAKARLLALVAPGGGVSLNASDRVSAEHLGPIVSSLSGDRARCDFDISNAVEGSKLTQHGTRAGIAILASGRLEVRRGTGVRSLSLDNPHIVGHHNRQNAAAAVAGALLAGVDESAWQPGLDAYAGIAHRLERVGEARGVAWFNDSKGTNVDATVTAIKSFAGRIHLIAGGLGKGAPYEPLVDAGRGKVLVVYTIGRDAPAIGAAFASAGVDVVTSGTLAQACADAMKRAQPGDVLLLSPACASFDQFRDYAHRGDSFRALFKDAEVTA